MQYKGFIGATYTGQSPTPACDRCINYYPEQMQGAGAPENNIVLELTPGLSVFCTLPVSSVAAKYTDPVTGRVFAIGGNTLFELSANGTFAARGAIAAGPYSFASQNSGQITIAAGGLGYVFTLSTNTLAQIPSGGSNGFNGASQFCTIDDYSIALTPNSREFQISSLLDGSAWDGLDFGAASGGPDNVLAFNGQHRELWLFTGTRCEIYVDDGAANFPFERLSGVYLDTGIAAPQSLVRLDNTLFWLSADERGSGIVCKANGYTPQRVSNHSVEYFIAQYQKYGGISDAVAYAYQEAGHSFYVLHFPSATSEVNAQGGTTQNVVLGATWVYDVATGMWHERAYWNAAKGQYQAHLGRCHTFGFGQHLVGDYQSGNVYVMSSDNYDDAGQVIRRVRRAPHLENELRMMFHSEFQVNLQTGAGSTADPNPMAWMRKSDDGGATWSSERSASLGTVGNYKTRVRWQMLGASRRRAYEWATTARVPHTLVDAYLRVTPGLS